MNFFSDGDLTPEPTSPPVSRPPTPKSDTEVEVYKNKREEAEVNQWNWDWGQLPERQTSPSSEIAKETERKEPLIEEKETKETSQSSSPEKGSPSKVTNAVRINIKPENIKTDGIYLEDTDKLDSEVAAIYLDQKTNSAKLSQKPTPAPPQISINKDDDQESGNGQSLPQSPLRDCFTILGDVQISLCGFSSNTINISNPQLPEAPLSPGGNSSLLSMPSSLPNTLTVSTSLNNLAEISTSPNIRSPVSPPALQSENTNFDDLFQQHSISFDKFIEEINTITQNPNLVLRINNRYMNWPSAGPIILAALVYHRSLSSDIINGVIEANTPKVKQTQQQQPTQPVDSKKSWRNGFFSG